MTRGLNHEIRVSVKKDRKLYNYLVSNGLPTSVVFRKSEFLFFLLVMYILFSVVFMCSGWSYFSILDRIAAM